jgi:hypothetical protein
MASPVRSWPRSSRCAATEQRSLTRCCDSARRDAVHTRDVPLTPGPFEGLDGARSGDGVIFENDIDSSTCFPGGTQRPDGGMAGK